MPNRRLFAIALIAAVVTGVTASAAPAVADTAHACFDELDLDVQSLDRLPDVMISPGDNIASFVVDHTNGTEGSITDLAGGGCSGGA